MTNLIEFDYAEFEREAQRRGRSNVIRDMRRESICRREQSVICNMFLWLLKAVGR